MGLPAPGAPLSDIRLPRVAPLAPSFEFARGWVADMDESSIGQSGESERSPSASLPRASGDSFADSFADAIISKNLDGIVLGWNRAAQRLLGYRADEIVGRDGAMIIPPDRIEEETRLMARLRAGEFVEGYQTRRRHKDGSDIAVEVTISVMHDHDGRVVAASKIMRQIPACNEVRASTDVLTRKRPGGTETESDEEVVMPHTLTHPIHQNRLVDLSCDRNHSGNLSSAVRVLLVEDHIDTLQATRRLLGALGYCVIPAPTGGEALERSAAEPFDVIVSDIGLPDATGYELMQQIKLGPAQSMKGIALSGYGMEEDVRRSRAAGFDDHVVKPVQVIEN